MYASPGTVLPVRSSAVVTCTMSNAPKNRRACVLISNDDGIAAPGLRELVAQLAADGGIDVHVCAPSGERSAQSHAITLGRYLSCFAAEVPGAVSAFAVDGTPADSVMLALHSPLFQGRKFDLVASGINRGDNAGLHVIYSGTVGAAREAACKGVLSVALSLADHKATRQSDYTPSAALAVHIIKAALDALNCGDAAAVAATGTVFNCNFPSASLGPVRGVALSHQGTSCVFPEFREMSEADGPHLPEIEQHTPNLRMFRNYAGEKREDESVGSDGAALAMGRASLTVHSLRSDVAPQIETNRLNSDKAAYRLAAFVVHAAANKAGLPALGLEQSGLTIGR